MVFSAYSGAVVGFRDITVGVPGLPSFSTSVSEGAQATLAIEGSGFAYGNVPARVTPLPCSDYPGDLSALFDNVPAASASLGRCRKQCVAPLSFGHGTILFLINAADLVDKDPMTSDLFVRSGFASGVGIAFQQYSLAIDGLVEGEECLLFIMSVNETELDPRDRGLVDITNGVALFRIQDLNGEWRKLFPSSTELKLHCFLPLQRSPFHQVCVFAILLI